MPDNKYRMSISLNILNHLGLNLYSNTPAVLAEVIANAWDADATKVCVDIDISDKTITVTDDGVGMDLDDINNKYLYVGYRKRKASGQSCELELLTTRGRKPMGRKGIGKLSLFSIANKIYVYSQKLNCEQESFLMDANKITSAIASEDPSSLQQYEPEPVKSDLEIPNNHGTVIKIDDLKKLRLTNATAKGLKKRIARRFSIISVDAKFTVVVNGQEVTVSDRDYFHKARFLFQYGSNDYSRYCSNLDTNNDGEKLSIKRECQFNESGIVTDQGQYKINGWIAIARRSNDLDDAAQDSAEQDENLNKITIVVRGKLAQEDILQEYRLGGMITKYIYGEIHADFLDEDDKQDITTSSRQRISEDDSRYHALKAFIGKELRHIWTETNKLKENKGLDMALSSNPYLKEWYEGIKPQILRTTAKKIFAVIDQAGVDESHRQKLYANGVLAFETLKMHDTLKLLDTVSINNVEEFLEHLASIDAIEAQHYYEIVQERLNVIQRLRDNVDINALEKVLQKFIFDHLWLLDPAWERATQFAEMEKIIQEVVNGISTDKNLRVDIQYKKVMASHVIVELKRADRQLMKTDLESQVRQYINAVRSELKKQNPQDQTPHIETVCIVGKLPVGWEDPVERRKDEESLRPHAIRIITYNELIYNAYSAYSKFIEKSENLKYLPGLIRKIKDYSPEE